MILKKLFQKFLVNWKENILSCPAMELRNLLSPPTPPPTLVKFRASVNASESFELNEVFKGIAELFSES